MEAAILGRVDGGNSNGKWWVEALHFSLADTKGQWWRTTKSWCEKFPASNFLSVLNAPRSPRLSLHVSCSLPCVHGPSLHLFSSVHVLPRLGSPAGDALVPSPSSAELKRIPPQWARSQVHMPGACMDKRGWENVGPLLNGLGTRWHRVWVRAEVLNALFTSSFSSQINL